MAEEGGAETTAAKTKVGALLVARAAATRGTPESASSANTTQRERDKGTCLCVCKIFGSP